MIKKHDIVYVTKAGRQVDVLSLERFNSKQRIRKISKEEYQVISTGEIKRFKMNKTRAENMNSLRKTVRQMIDIINSNFYGDNNELMITLTYSENMQDTNKLYEDVKYFIKKLREYTEKKQGQFKYIIAVEPQKRGAWHAHLLCKFVESNYVYLDNDTEINKLWKHGFTKTQRLKRVKNAGTYLASYLTNVKEGEKTEKGKRLELYPSGLRIFRCSRDIKKPVKIVTTYENLKRNMLKDVEARARYEGVIKNGDYEMKYEREQYRLPREEAETNWRKFTIDKKKLFILANAEKKKKEEINIKSIEKSEFEDFFNKSY